MRLLRHPLVVFGLGVVVGHVFTSQVGRIPVVNKIPQKG
jgi:hypothetical protein